MLKIFLNIYRNSGYASTVAKRLLELTEQYENVTVSFRHSAIFVHIVIELRYTIQNQAEVDSYFHPQNGRFIILSEAFEKNVFIHETINPLGGTVYKLDAGSIDWLIYQMTWTPPEIPEAYQYPLKGKTIGYSQSWAGFLANLDKVQQAYIFKTIVQELCTNDRGAVVQVFKECDQTSVPNHIKELAKIVNPQFKEFFTQHAFAVDAQRVLELIHFGCQQLNNLDTFKTSLLNLHTQGN